MQEIVQIEIELSLITANWPKPRHPSTLVSRAADRWTLAMGMKQGDLCNFCIFDLDMACHGDTNLVAQSSSQEYTAFCDSLLDGVTGSVGAHCRYGLAAMSSEILL